MAYLGIGTERTNTLHVRWDALRVTTGRLILLCLVILETPSSRAFLAELYSYFQGIGTIRVSNTLADTLTSSDAGRARELTEDIKANAMLMMISAINCLRPDRINEIVLDILVPVVHGVYEHLWDTHNLYCTFYFAFNGTLRSYGYGNLCKWATADAWQVTYGF